MVIDKPKLSISTNTARSIPAIKEAFDGFDVEFKGILQQKSFGDIAMQVIIFLSGAFIGGATWDLFKVSVRKLLTKFPNAQIIIRDSNSIMYTIKDDNNVMVIVVPDRVHEFSHIQTLDDLIQHLKKDD